MKTMNIKKVFIIMVCMSVFQTVLARHTMREVWISMPDSILTYLNENMRRELVELTDMGVKAEIKNVFQEETVLDTITDNYIGVKLNNSVSMQMRMLTKDDSTQVICMVRTFSAPETESVVRFYNTEWTALDDTYGLPADRSEAKLLGMLTARPDTMTQQRYEELCDMIDPVMMSACLSKDSDVVYFTLGVPMLNDDEKKDVKNIIKQRFFKWDGKIFKEC